MTKARRPADIVAVDLAGRLIAELRHLLGGVGPTWVADMERWAGQFFHHAPVVAEGFDFYRREIAVPEPDVPARRPPMHEGGFERVIGRGCLCRGRMKRSSQAHHQQQDPCRVHQLPARRTRSA